MCLPRVADAIGAEPYNARLRYTGPADPDHPNKIKLTVTMPHVGKWLKIFTVPVLQKNEKKCSNQVDQLY